MQPHVLAPVSPGVVAWGERLTLGFGMATAMWGLGFATRLPGVELPPVLVFVILHVCLLAGGRLASSVRQAALAGALTGAINLLILGAVLRSLDGDFGTYAAIWGPATLVFSALVAALGRATGGPAVVHREAFNPWASRLAIVAAAATLLVISVGGSVTGYEAGLAVPDWPNTFGYNMFLFPLAKMTGGIYFEHAHRLIGTLVGLTTLVFAVYVAGLARGPRWTGVVAVVAFVLVVTQGLLGALRVTGKFTLSDNPADMEPSTAMGMVHGTLAQVIFSLLVLLGCGLSRTWRQAGISAGVISRNGIAAMVLVLSQIIIGVLLRHAGDEFRWALHLHITLAFVVAGVVAALGVRSVGRSEHPPVTRFGAALLWVLGAQMLLGFLALAAIMVDSAEDGAHPAQVLVTTIHQTTGALLLGGTVALVAWRYRLGLNHPDEVADPDVVASRA